MAFFLGPGDPPRPLAAEASRKPAGDRSSEWSLLRQSEAYSAFLRPSSILEQAFDVHEADKSPFPLMFSESQEVAQCLHAPANEHQTAEGCATENQKKYRRVIKKGWHVGISRHRMPVILHKFRASGLSDCLTLRYRVVTSMLE